MLSRYLLDFKSRVHYLQGWTFSRFIHRFNLLENFDVKILIQVKVVQCLSLINWYDTTRNLFLIRDIKRCKIKPRYLRCKGPDLICDDISVSDIEREIFSIRRIKSKNSRAFNVYTQPWVQVRGPRYQHVETLTGMLLSYRESLVATFDPICNARDGGALQMLEGGNNLHVLRIIHGREHARTKPERICTGMHCGGRGDVVRLL